MSTPQENAVPAVQAPAAIPWYKSAVFRGFLTAFFTQVIARIAAKYHIDIGVLASFGINVDFLVQLTLDGLSTAAGAYALHGRAVKTLPAITLTKKQADAANAAAVPVDPSPTLGESK